jgi:hypothetical protein
LYTVDKPDNIRAIDAFTQTYSQILGITMEHRERVNVDDMNAVKAYLAKIREFINELKDKYEMS